MLYLSSNTTPDQIVEVLLEQPRTAKQIGEALKNRGISLSTSGLYKALNQLEEDAVILKTKKLFSISSEWKKDVIETLGREDELDIKDGESVTFNVKSASQMDRYWKHYAFLLEEESLKHGLCFYNPHQFWIHIPDRAQSEKDFITYTKEKKIPVYHTLGNATAFDKVFGREHRSKTYQINFENIYRLSDLDNITLFGDYILNTKVDAALYEEIDAAYRTASGIEELKSMIATAVDRPHRYKFRLERNHRKAEQLARRLKKHFVVR